MVEPATRTPSVLTLTPEQRVDLHQLAEVAGLDIRREALNSIIDLLAIGAKPHNLGPILQAICKPSGIASASRQSSSDQPQTKPVTSLLHIVADSTMAASALFVLDLKGRVLLSRDYRGDVNPKQAERFITKLNELEESGKVTPVILDEGVSYIYVQYSNLYLLAVAKNNINVGSILLFLHKLKEIFTHYFQELEEESLRDNFVIAYELLDEV